MKNFTINNTIKIAILFLLVGCSNAVKVGYESLENRSQKQLRQIDVVIDTLIVDGSATSMNGSWFIVEDQLYFSDAHIVGVKQFDGNGQFIATHINEGRGPNEMTSPAFLASAIGDNSILMIDPTMWLYKCDTQFNFSIRDKPFAANWLPKSDQDIERMQKADAEDGSIYEFNISIPCVKAQGANIVAPIITEHYAFNGYFAQTAKYWKEAYLLAYVDGRTLDAGKMFGHYPPIYSRINIPNMSFYDFDVFSDDLFVSFAADSLIYVFDNQGDMKYSFGNSSSFVTDQKYVKTATFEDADSRRLTDLNEMSYYLDVMVAGQYLLRSYKNHGVDAGGGVQVYENGVLINDFATQYPLKFVGTFSDRTIIALHRADENEEEFQFLKIRL